MNHARHMMIAVLIIAATAPLAWAENLTTEIKWSQPPDLMADGRYNGWDEPSIVDYPIVADDFRCDDPRPVVDLHWWGSYPGYLADTGVTPPVSPDAFLIRFWSDVPDPNPNDPADWSHPGELLWTIDAKDYLEVAVGIDVDPRPAPNGGEDTMFQYNQTFNPDEYFSQEPGTIYWISIQAFWDAAGSTPPLPMGMENPTSLLERRRRYRQTLRPLWGHHLGTHRVSSRHELGHGL